MKQLEEKADIYFIDEIGDRQLFSDKVQNRILDIMDDKGAIVIATIQKHDRTKHDSKLFDFTNYVK